MRTKHTLTAEIAAILRFYRDVARRVDDQPTEGPTKALRREAIRPKMRPDQPQPEPDIEHELIACIVAQYEVLDRKFSPFLRIGH